MKHGDLSSCLNLYVQERQNLMFTATGKRLLPLLKLGILKVGV